MKDQLPEKAAEKLKERKAELEQIELKKILEEKEAKKDEEQPSSSKPGRREIPPHILAKIRAKQAAKVNINKNKENFLKNNYGRQEARNSKGTRISGDTTFLKKHLVKNRLISGENTPVLNYL